MNKGLLNQKSGNGMGANGLLGFPQQNNTFSTIISGFAPLQIANLRMWLQKGVPGYGSTWTDGAVGNSLNGTLTGATWINNAVYFSGGNQYVEGFGQSISPQVQTGVERTVCIWATSNDSSFSRRGLIGTRASGSSNGFFFSCISSTQVSYQLPPVTAFTATITMPAANTRNMWAVTHSGSTATIYLNGVQVAQNTSMGNEQPSTFNGRIGGEQGGSATENWSGFVDTVLTYTRALTLSEIQLLYTYM